MLVVGFGVGIGFGGGLILSLVGGNLRLGGDSDKESAAQSAATVAALVGAYQPRYVSFWVSRALGGGGNDSETRQLATANKLTT